MTLAGAVYNIYNIRGRIRSRRGHIGVTGARATKLTALAAYRSGRLCLPPGYRVLLDGDVLTVRRADDSMVAVFVAAAAPSAVARAAEDDYRAVGETVGA